MNAPAGGRVALITGGTRGIGAVLVDAFQARGDRVSVCGLDRARLAASRADLSMLADVRDTAAVESWVEASVDRFGRIDVLVNNAGRAWAGEFADQGRDSIAGLVEQPGRNAIGSCVSV